MLFSRFQGVVGGVTGIVTKPMEGESIQIVNTCYACDGHHFFVLILLDVYYLLDSAKRPLLRSTFI